MSLSVSLVLPSGIPIEKVSDADEKIAVRFGHTFSKFEVYNSLEPTLQKIEQEKGEKFRLLNMLQPTLRHTWGQVKQYPLLTGGKMIMAFALVYLLRNIVRGIISGEVLFKDIPFSQVLSSNKNTRLNAGQYLTNAANNASFTMDGLWMLYGIYCLFFRNPYNRTARDNISEIYNMHMERDSLTKAQIDELYDLMIRELKNYEGFGFEMELEIQKPLEMVKIEKMPSDDECTCSPRSKLDVRKSIEGILQEIHKEIREKSGLSHILGHILKNCFHELKEKPFVGIGKVIILCGIGYMLKNIFMGIYSGEELFYDVPFSGVFSSNVTNQEIAAGYLTNAGSNASFTLDGSFLLYIAYVLFLDGAYNKAMHSIINESCINVLKGKNLPIEELNELYNLINRELDNYGGYRR